MKNLTLIIALLGSLFVCGCGNLSPRNEQRIDNQDGKIDDIRSNQNGVMAEIGKLKNDAEILNSRLEKVQQGVVNLQSNYESSYENSGVQVFSGPGGIMTAIVGFVCSTIIILHYRSVAKKNEKTANILAERIVNQNDPDLEEAVFQAALHTNVEENVLGLIKKHKI